MTKAVEKILEEVNALNDAERDELFDMLRVATEPSTDPEYIAAWDAEIRDRLADIESGTAKMIPWEQALEMIRRGEVDGEAT